MELLQAIHTRKSIRAFTRDPVPRKTIEKILEISQRAPSGTNIQPWLTYVCAGRVRDAIETDVLELVRAGKTDPGRRQDEAPSTMKDVHIQRRRQVGWTLYGLLGIQKGDREASARQSERNFKFFDAPVGLFFTTHASLGRASWVDVGLYLQTVMLVAREFGIHTCPQGAWSRFQGTIFRHLEIADDQVLVCGMSLGYSDDTAIENTLISQREDLANVVRFVGFD